jgi:hypothetical protein
MNLNNPIKIEHIISPPSMEPALYYQSTNQLTHELETKLSSQLLNILFFNLVTKLYLEIQNESK